jgi:hypothetical protein
VWGAAECGAIDPAQQDPLPAASLADQPAAAGEEHPLGSRGVQFLFELSKPDPAGLQLLDVSLSFQSKFQ